MSDEYVYSAMITMLSIAAGIVVILAVTIIY